MFKRDEGLAENYLKIYRKFEFSGRFLPVRWAINRNPGQSRVLFPSKIQADELKESLFRLKFRKSLGVGDVVGDIRREKKVLARVYTILQERELEAKETKAQAQ